MAHRSSWGRLALALGFLVGTAKGEVISSSLAGGSGMWDSWFLLSNNSPDLDPDHRVLEFGEFNRSVERILTISTHYVFFFIVSFQTTQEIMQIPPSTAQRPPPAPLFVLPTLQTVPRFVVKGPHYVQMVTAQRPVRKDLNLLVHAKHFPLLAPRLLISTTLALCVSRSSTMPMLSA